MHPFYPPVPSLDELPSYQFVQVKDVERMIEAAVKPLIIKVLQLEAGLSEWVRAKEAMAITGVLRPETLKRHREMKDAIIKHEKRGKADYYLRSSLLEFCESRDSHRGMRWFNGSYYTLLTPLGQPATVPEIAAPPRLRPAHRTPRY